MVLRAQDEMLRVEEEAAKARADAEAVEETVANETLAAKLRAKVEGLFDLPALAPLRTTAQPLLDLLAEHELAVFALLGVPALLLLLPLLSVLGGSKVRS